MATLQPNHERMNTETDDRPERLIHLAATDAKARAEWSARLFLERFQRQHRTPAKRAAVAQALLDGNPGWPDAPDLSGEWADGMTPGRLHALVGCADHDEPELLDEIDLAWIEAADEAFDQHLRSAFEHYAAILR